jgi:tRNA (guanine37-N1)-methyltransferase
MEARQLMHAAVITVFPEMFNSFQRLGVSGRALERGLAELTLIDPRDFSGNKHRRVDDRPYGGGPGMVMLAQPLQAAIEAAETQLGGRALRVCLSPQGRRLDQAALHELSGHERLLLVCGRYEGIDERIIESSIDAEYSIGDYVLSGGELAAMVVLDGLIRLIPGALGHAQSAAQDSFEGGLLDCPHYSRPERIENMAVPAVLLSGDHEAIRRWRLKQSLGRTWQRRPDLLNEQTLSEEQMQLLREFRAELD